MIYRQDLRVEVLGVVLLHHVLVYGQPRRADAQFTCPGVAQLLRGRWEKKNQLVEIQLITEHMCMLLLWCQLWEMLAFVWPEQRTETKSNQSDWMSLIVAQWPCCNRVFLGFFLRSTFWMLSSTRPPRTYALSASTVSKAEMKEELKKKIKKIAPGKDSIINTDIGSSLRLGLGSH